MAAPAADQPTTLSYPLVLPSLTLPIPYHPTHTSDTTSTSPVSSPSIGSSPLWVIHGLKPTECMVVSDMSPSFWLREGEFQMITAGGASHD